MERKDVKELINELKQCDATYQNCNDLAALLTLDEKLGTEQIEREIGDILPAYLKYITIKTKYQTGTEEKDRVICALKALCGELLQLIQLLYSSSDMPLERIEIQNMIQLLYNRYLRR